MNVAVLGARGRMGTMVVAEVQAAEDLTLVAALDRGEVGPGCFAAADAVIDFSLPEGIDAALPHLGNIALVSGTTGLDAAAEARRQAHAERGPLLVAANFSLGVNLLLGLVAQASAALPDAAIEIVEAHHRHKRDAPSGTALALADATGHDGVGMHSLRGGDVVGEHTVHLLLDGERIALGHTATARSTFAVGAVRAARWLAGRSPGRYGMADVLGLHESRV